MIRELLLDESIDMYRQFYTQANIKTIYHHPDYLLAEEKAEEYATYFYLYEDEGVFVILPSVKRRINDIDVYEDESEEYFDLITPHEYAGVMSNTSDAEKVNMFYSEMKQYCERNNIIFHFIRLNPYGKEHNKMESYDIKFVDKHRWLDCRGDILSHFQKRKAQYVKSAIRNGIQCLEAEKTEKNINMFCQYYQKTMNRLGAKKFLYFNQEYFQELCKHDFVKLFFVSSEEKQIFSGMIILCDLYHKRLYYHLSFRNDEGKTVHSMEYMIYAAGEWAKDNGYEFMHLGGGSETLHHFKDRCTNKTEEYYIGYFINRSIYERLSEKYIKRYPDVANSSFLPLYRSKE